MRKIQTEIRECVQCGDTYDWNLRNIYCLCVPCRKRHYRKKQKLSAGEYKKPYPLNENEKRNRYRRIQRELDAATTKESRREIYGRELDYMIESGIWEWCIDLRFSNKIVNAGIGAGRPKSKELAPDTRGWYE